MKNLNEKEIVNLLVEASLIEDVESVTNVFVASEFDSAILVDSLEGDFRVYSTYDDAEQDAIEECKEIIEDCGLTDNLMNIAYNHGFIDEGWFKDYWTELYEEIAYNEDIQYIASDEQLEMLENGEMEEDDIRDWHFDSLLHSIDGQWMEEYRGQFGEQDLNITLLNNNLIDIEELAKYCVDVDGVASYLATYDHEEVEHDGYYIYRTN